MKKFRRIDSSDPIIYCDAVALESGYFGFKFSFGSRRMGGADPNKPDVIDEHVKVGMSAEHAMALFQALRQQLELHEKTCGPVRAPRRDPAADIVKVEKPVLIT
jgi:hypothetical protein